jgi:hypothetical protein
MSEIPIDPALLDCDLMYKLIQAEGLPESSTATIKTREDNTQFPLNSLELDYRGNSNKRLTSSRRLS